MVDLNLTYGTVTDGGGDRVFITPGNANDGSATSRAYRDAFYGTVATSRLKSDLGAARLVSAATITYGLASPVRMQGLEHSADGSSWTDASPTITEADGVQTMALAAAVSARYWRIVHATTGSGYQYPIFVYTWELLEGDPPPPPTPGVLADWDGDGFGADGSDDDITGHVRSWTVTRGQSPELTGGSTPGTATLVLNNPADDRYNPRNGAGPLAGLLTDGVPIWWGVADDGTFTGTGLHGVFGGRTKDITPVPQGGGGRALTVEITCEDALGWLGRTPVRLEDALYRSQGAFRSAVLTAAGETSVLLPSEIHTIPLSSWDGTALAALEELNRANGTRHFIRPGGSRATWYTYEAHNRQHKLNGAADAALDAGADHVTSSGGWRLSADTVINQQKATVTPIRLAPAAMTVWQADAVPFTVKTGAPRTLWAEFDDFVADPVVDSTSTGSALTATLTPFGTTAKIVLASAGTTTVTSLSVEGSLARRGAPESHVADDLASQAGWRGVRAGQEIASGLVGVMASATGIAEHIVWRYGTPQYRPTLTVVNWLPEQFEIDIGDVLAVTIDQLSADADLFEVVGLTHTSDLAATDADGNPVVSHTTVYVLQECRVQAYPGWFTLDASLLDGADILAY